MKRIALNLSKQYLIKYPLLMVSVAVGSYFSGMYWAIGQHLR